LEVLGTETLPRLVRDKTVESIIVSLAMVLSGESYSAPELNYTALRLWLNKTVSLHSQLFNYYFYTKV
jgi:hypothetical protein